MRGMRRGTGRHGLYQERRQGPLPRVQRQGEGQGAREIRLSQVSVSTI